MPLLPEYLKLNDGTDFDYIIKFKRHWWSKWHYVSDGLVPMTFTKERAEEIVKLIKEKKIYL